jgi:hypothetical protein
MIFKNYFKLLIIYYLTMSAILPLIEEAIDVPLMDIKNVAPIIEGYCKYTFFEETDISSLTIDVSDPAEQENYNLEKRFIVSDDAYYVLEDPTYGIEFKNGEVSCKDRSATCAMIRFKETPEKYLFINNGWSIGMWRIIKKFATDKAFNQYGSRELAKWARIYKAPLLLNDRYINIKYDDTYIFNGNPGEDEVGDFTPETAKQVYDTFFL